MVLIMDMIVKTVDLGKTYGKTQALGRLTLDIRRGEIYGLIGPNGAGKTTTLALLAGLVRPSSGRAWIGGVEVLPGDGRTAALTGFASPQFPLLDYLTGREILTACGRLHRLDRSEVARRTGELLEMLEIDGAADRYIGRYSLGMKQKIALGCALIHAPEVCLFDEPFLGLDPAAVFRLLGLFRRMASGGRTLILSSHDMGRMERLCDRVGILHQGLLQREIGLAPAGAGRVSPPPPELESALWEVAGGPGERELSWI
jgi:ABC-2 type transport system ATP-binding protein